MYPHGRAECGALDVAGNLWEWCLNDYSKPEIIDGYSNGEQKVLRGGSFRNHLNFAAASYRNHFNPNLDLINYGFRVVCAAPISAL
jgi:formylglycine-generating enzyme required for sulfatase activity